ncbi:hypothetical protein [Haloferula sargassicola]|uniref:Uncharacterized protein n=1 Tax=Haloferula sargassicola TaxID=490096 RepID=A0ABP9UKA0_9BACT
MRLRFLLPILLSLATGLSAQSLTQSDREALLDKLKKIQDAADAKVEARFSMAVAAFREGAGSEEAAMDLYLKCVEKVDFEDQYKKSQDFREWKRKESDHLKSMGFKRALRHQLRWLILTLQVASHGPPTRFADQAGAAVDDVFSDLNLLKDEERTLRQGVTGTVFARAYEITDVQVDDWPMSPVDLEAVYDKVLLPPLRKPESTDGLRAMWMRRIQQEIDGRETWTRRKRGEDGPNRVGMKDALRTPEMDKFIAETYPELLWKMEVDVYEAGDERGAALRMFQHLEKYVDHPKAEDWAGEFATLLRKPDEQTEVAPTHEEAAVAE